MALWIASDLGKQKEAFIVRAGVGLDKIPKVKNWKVVRRMSLMENKIDDLVGSPECLELTTLLLQKNANLSTISSEFFKSMPKLAVLDLSVIDYLSELPEEISNLVSLQYLNLSHCTDIHHLPKGLQELRKLIHLDLEGTSRLHSISGISSLQNLKVLKLDGSGFRWDLNTMDELEALERLEILTIRIGYSSQGAEHYYLSSQRLMSCTTSLEITNLESARISLPATMDKLRKFSIHGYSKSEIKMGRKCSFLSLSEVNIENSQGLRELTFRMFAPNLRSLSVRRLYQLEDIISKEKACEVDSSGIVPFQKLNDLCLVNLPKLKNIYWSHLPFPCLQEIYVSDCPNLKKLPVDSKSGNHDGLILTYREKEWIEGVEWEDEATKTRFLSSCQLEEEPDIYSVYESDDGEPDEW